MDPFIKLLNQVKRSLSNSSHSSRNKTQHTLQHSHPAIGPTLSTKTRWTTVIPVGRSTSWQRSPRPPLIPHASGTLLKSQGSRL